ncbi:MAG TPA: hypothetical protein VF555_16510 [Variovorax sp.]
MINPQAWVKRRARNLMATFGAKGTEAVREAFDDWKALVGKSAAEKLDFRRFMTKVKGEVA